MAGLLKSKQTLYLICFVCVAVLAINYIAFTVLWNSPAQMEPAHTEEISWSDHESHEDSQPPNDNNGLPVILWWTDFKHDPGSVGRCGKVSCYFTNNRKFKNHKDTKMLMFYGSMLELHDLPLPRLPHEQWALIHEESPKNNWAFCNPKFMSLFNYTATFQRSSDYPVTLQWLTTIKEIESKKYYYTVEEKNKFIKEEGLAPIAFVNSDCGTPSDRDNLVEMLSKHINIDSMGKCLHNKELPSHLQDPLEGMFHDDFYELLSKYKFVIAAENAICDDYVTEKFWRSFYVGSVPIIYGSPSIKDWLPTAGSAIVVQDYDTVSALYEAINHLNTDDAAYTAATRYKTHGVDNKLLLSTMRERKWTVNDVYGTSFFELFPCQLCEKLHQPLEVTHKMSKELKCPQPREFDISQGALTPKPDSPWYMWQQIYQRELSRGDILYNAIAKRNITKNLSQRAVDDELAGRLSENLSDKELR